VTRKSQTPPPPRPESSASQESAQQIWLAGLGAFAQAQQQGGQVFKSLVQEGLAMQRKTQEAARAQMAQASEKLSSLATGLGSRAGQPWDRLEGIFEERVARALQRLDIASREEVEALRERVEALESRLRQAGQGRTTAKGERPQAGSPGARPAAKRAKRAD